VSEVPHQESGEEDLQAGEPAVDQLSFLDLLYAVPVGDLAMRVSGAKLAQVSAADWSMLAVILATIVLSWIGLHKDRKAMIDETHGRGPIGQMPFLGPQFVQFGIEIVIVGVYFTMGLFLKLPMSSEPSAEEWLTGLLFGIFVLYLLWDLMDIRLAGSVPWRELAKAGAWVTGGFSAAAGIIFGLVLIRHPRTAISVVALNAMLVIFLYVYRVVQDKRGNTRQKDEPETVLIRVS
jgi:hypothetical protein